MVSIESPITARLLQIKKTLRMVSKILTNTSKWEEMTKDFRPTSAQKQLNQLDLLLKKAKKTAFGRYYDFANILKSTNPADSYRRNVPAMDYNTIYDRWWSQAYLHDVPDICWPGLTPYYALSSGTSQAATKYIPVTDDMLGHMKRGARKMLVAASSYHLPARQYAKQMLMVGSCTQPKWEGQHHTGDLSGILGLNRPLWMERLYRPGRAISDLPDWNDRIELIAQEAPKWDIGFAVSNPMWLQLILERVIEKHKLEHIHEIWPNFSLYVHGGVFFEPYKHNFEQLLGKPIGYLDSYMASEGLFAWQRTPDNRSMKLIANGGIYFEFVPFNDEQFDEDGNLRSEYPTSLNLDEVVEGQNYAMLISTCAGAWRYLLGDTLIFTDVAAREFRLSGRTKQYLSVCGEHLSIDNLNEAVRRVDEAFNAGIKEFTVAGLANGARWAHQWYISCSNPEILPTALAQAIDKELGILNEDYAVERAYALNEVRLDIVPNSLFMDWLSERGKMNGQAKIPRVLKGQQLADFQAFIG
jgi:hypothetical protein